MKSDVNISVIIPAYNCSKTITRALDSVLLQSHLPIEIIVVNDGSSDNTIEVIEAYGHSNIIKLISVENGGPARARNIGIEEASGNWFAFLDADDLWTSSGKLAKQRELVLQNDKAVLIDTFAEVFQHRKQIKKVRKMTKNGYVFKDFLVNNVINATSSVLAKAEAIRLQGGFQEGLNFGEDRLLWAKVSQLGTLHTVQEYCVYKENHAENLTSKGVENLKHRVDMIEQLFSLIKISNSEREYLWFVNVKSWATEALRARSWQYYLKVGEIALGKTKKRFLFSRLSPLYFACLIFARVGNKV